MSALRSEVLLCRAKTGRIEDLTEINLWGHNLTDISAIREAVNLKVISLSDNLITSLKHIQPLEKLEKLFIKNNKIKDLNEILHLRDLPQLQLLWLEGNPCTRTPHYRSTIIRNLPKLEILDQKEIDAGDRYKAKTKGKVLPQLDDSSTDGEGEDYETSSEQNDDARGTEMRSAVREAQNSAESLAATPVVRTSQRSKRKTSPTQNVLWLKSKEEQITDRTQAPKRKSKSCRCDGHASVTTDPLPFLCASSDINHKAQEFRAMKHPTGKNRRRSREHSPNNECQTTRSPVRSKTCEVIMKTDSDDTDGRFITDDNYECIFVNDPLPKRPSTAPVANTRLPTTSSRSPGVGTASAVPMTPASSRQQVAATVSETPVAPVSQMASMVQMVPVAQMTPVTRLAFIPQMAPMTQMAQMTRVAQMTHMGPMAQIGPMNHMGMTQMGPVAHVGPMNQIGPMAQMGPMVAQMGPMAHMGTMGHIGPVAQMGSVGHIGPMNHMGQMSQMGPMGQMGSMGQMGPMAHMGPVGQMGQISQMGSISQMGPMTQWAQMAPIAYMGPMAQMGPMTQLVQVPFIYPMSPMSAPNLTESYTTQKPEIQNPAAASKGSKQSNPRRESHEAYQMRLLTAGLSMVQNVGFSDVQDVYSDIRSKMHQHRSAKGARPAKQDHHGHKRNSNNT